MDRRDLLKGAAGSTLLAATSGLAAADDAPSPVLRIHPAIGVARIGNSPDYYLAPETAAGELPPSGEGLWGGLPLDAATGQPLTADGFRDGQGRLKRQAVRFRIYAYTRTGWPTGESTEITLGAVIGGKRVVDIVWQVHVANKKLNTFGMMNPIGHFPALPGFADGKLMPIRRPQDGPAGEPGPPQAPRHRSRPARPLGPHGSGARPGFRSRHARELPCRGGRRRSTGASPARLSGELPAGPFPAAHPGGSP